MKQITSRPSAFITVELADFMSYLDSVLLQLDEKINLMGKIFKMHFFSYLKSLVCQLCCLFGDLTKRYHLIYISTSIFGDNAF